MVLLDLFFAASDTTSAGLEFAIGYLLQNPNVMEKTRQEIDFVIGANGSPQLIDKKRLNITLIVKACQRYVKIINMVITWFGYLECPIQKP